MAFQCKDVSLIPGLEAIQLRGGVAAADKVVRWPYLAENRSFTDWVKGGELVFVTGISRHRNPENLAECLYEGQTSGISGLVVLTGDAYIGQLPTTLCRLADELALPLFEQPYSLPMVEVTEAISRAIIWSEAAQKNAFEPEIWAGLSALLEAWIDCRGNLSAMAEALGCHRNTVRNRMKRASNSHTISDQGIDVFRARLLAHLLMKSPVTMNHPEENR